MLQGRPLLVCPGCRAMTDEGLALRTLDRAGELLRCACGRRYPVVDGVPLLLADPTQYLIGEALAVVEGELSPELAEVLAETGPDDAPVPRLLEHLSIYLDAHWGDRANPPPDGPAPPWPLAELHARVAARASEPVAHAIELGCSAGRIVAALAAGAEHVVGLDLHFGSLRRARKLVAGQPLRYARRQSGRAYLPVELAASGAALADERITWLCADALDPPLVPESFQRVVAFNLLDAVRKPRQLLHVLDGLCAPGGELLLSSPYAWQSAVVDESERFGGADPAGWLRRHLERGDELRARYHIEEECELPWILRKDARSAVSYRLHYLRARKQP